MTEEKQTSLPVEVSLPVDGQSTGPDDLVTMGTKQVSPSSIFQKGRYVKHYAHGVGVIADITEEVLYGVKLRLIHVQVGSLKLQIPEGKVASQLFPLSTMADWDKALPVLGTKPQPLQQPWHSTATKLAERLEVGTLVSLCEVLRDTAQRGDETISFSRREFVDTALTRLVEEYRVTFGVSREEAVNLLQQHCPFVITRHTSDRQHVITRTRNTRRGQSGATGYRELYKPPSRPVREKIEKVPKPKREPKVKIPREPKVRVPKPKREPKPKPPTKQQQILVLEEQVKSLQEELAVAKESLAREQVASAAKVAELDGMLTAARENVKELTRARGILQSQVTRLKKGKRAEPSHRVVAKEIKDRIAAVRTELFDFITERTMAVERLEAYIRELTARLKT
ncbi:MAG: hypothetical protein MUF19_03650 [Candidatus Pacebacteria bacterium]|jgi:RNA polymerase-interacting CarD/CdnL/TRCF family regulator|nr:hypothetical protein [Candidatus Paceibacterota bacterium]